MKSKISKLNFHDSCLMKFEISNKLDEIKTIICTPNNIGDEKYHLMQFSGILRFEYESQGVGIPPMDFVDIYEIYEIDNNIKKDRWITRLKKLGLNDSELKDLHCIVLASIDYFGWGQNKDLAGITIVCRNVNITNIGHDEVKILIPD